MKAVSIARCFFTVFGWINVQSDIVFGGFFVFRVAVLMHHDHLGEDHPTEN
jgi:hypothetical protein